MTGLRHRGEQSGERGAKVGPNRSVIEETRRGAGLKGGTDARLDWSDMTLVPAVRRNREVIGVEDRDLDTAILDLRAPVGYRRIAVS